MVRDEVKLGLHQMVVQKDGYMIYTVVEVLPRNVVTTKVVADLTPFATAATLVPTTVTIPSAPTKSPVPLAGLLTGLATGPVLVLRRCIYIGWRVEVMV